MSLLNSRLIRAIDWRGLAVVWALIMLVTAVAALAQPSSPVVALIFGAMATSVTFVLLRGVPDAAAPGHRASIGARPQTDDASKASPTIAAAIEGEEAALGDVSAEGVDDTGRGPARAPRRS